MYKTLFVVSVFLFASQFFALQARAEPKRYMFCLGQEEARIHKNKIGGAVYKLNQEVIGALVQLSDSIYMKTKHVKEVCSSPYPSIKILELLLSEENVFFSRYTGDRRPKLLALDERLLSELKNQSAYLFSGFMATLQAGMPKPDCLRNQIPELNEFFEKMLYAQENLGLKKIIDLIEDPKNVEFYTA